jgi:hypothetical protein
MICMDMPVIIPILATGYLFTIYLLLTLAQRTIKNSPYMESSLTDTYAHYMTSEQTAQGDKVEAWSRSVSGASSVASKELSPSSLTSSKVQKVSS